MAASLHDSFVNSFPGKIRGLPWSAIRNKRVSAQPTPLKFHYTGRDFPEMRRQNDISSKVVILTEGISCRKAQFSLAFEFDLTSRNRG